MHGCKITNEPDRVNLIGGYCQRGKVLPLVNCRQFETQLKEQQKQQQQNQQPNLRHIPNQGANQ